VTAENRFMDGVITGAFDRRHRAARRYSDAGRREQGIPRFAKNFEAAAIERRSVDQASTSADCFCFLPSVRPDRTEYRSITAGSCRCIYAMGAKVPSIYGESYDAREDRERAEAARQA
jgi:hypothetical protein